MGAGHRAGPPRGQGRVRPENVTIASARRKRLPAGAFARRIRYRYRVGAAGIAAKGAICEVRPMLLSAILLLIVLFALPLVLDHGGSFREVDDERDRR